MKILVLSIFVMFEFGTAVALDEGTKEYGASFAKSANAVVIGVFDVGDDKDDLEDENAYFKSMSVHEILKGDINKTIKLEIKLPKVYKLLDQPEVLLSARMEARRLSGCMQVLNGTFIKDPNDKTVCESDMSEIDKKMSAPGFVAQSSLGYYLERGWKLKFDKGNRFLVFLKLDNNGNYFIDQPHLLVPLENETLEEIDLILFPE